MKTGLFPLLTHLFTNLFT